jgi:UDP-N-acetylmuramyl pentapeptide phosphotransferase/UDP-N-acetylglucosamine-1-phosphate transferase
MLIALGSFFGMFLITALALYAARNAFPRLGLLDFPERYNLQRPRLPYPSGAAIVGAFIIVFASTQTMNIQNLGVLFAILFLALLSFIDDRTPLSPMVRLGAQCTVGLIVFLTGTRIFSLTNPFELWTGIPVVPLDRFVVISETFSNPSIIGSIFTIVWLCLTMNAMNWLDGIPGQVDAHATIGFIVIGSLAFSDRVEQPQVAILAFILAGMAAASLSFHFPPARMILGDTGAMFYGLLLGILTIYAGGKLATAFLVLGIPLVDCGVVVMRRILRKQSPLRSTPEHLHHLLLRRGWTPQSIILLTTTIGTAFGSTALVLSSIGKAAALLLLIVLVSSLSIWAQRRNGQGLT